MHTNINFPCKSINYGVTPMTAFKKGDIVIPIICRFTISACHHHQASDYKNFKQGLVVVRILQGKTCKVLLLLKCSHSISSPVFKDAMKSK